MFFQELDTSQVLIDQSGRATEYFESFLSGMQIIIGTGSPENVVSADPTRLYMDDSGSAGNVLYIKQTGTGNTGWVLI